jgi:hypothetical protein
MEFQLRLLIWLSFFSSRVASFLNETQRERAQSCTGDGEKKMKNSCCREEILFQIKKHRTSIRDCNQEASEEGKKAPKTGRKILNFDHDRGC